jgi:sec-independent protein translocase protein TatA
MLSNLTGWHFLIILVIIMLLFGAPKLPGLARSLGQSMKIFKSEITPDSPPPATTTGGSDPASPTATTPTGPPVNESRSVEPPTKL